MYSTAHEISRAQDTASRTACSVRLRNVVSLVARANHDFFLSGETTRCIAVCVPGYCHRADWRNDFSLGAYDGRSEVS